ncbi:MAG: MAPEG family protein [Arenimonas sp.]
MTTALYCILAAGLMPYLWTAVAKFSGPRYNNWNVRIWQSKLEGAAQRAHAAHLNSFEAFPLFAVAVIVAQLNGADQARIDLLALSFIGLRILYGILYMANKAPLRSLVWLAAMVCVVMIFVAGK